MKISLLAFSKQAGLTLLFVTATLFHPPKPETQPLEEVPFIISPDNVTLEMLSSAGVKRGDHVIDLGSGDEHIVILAAKRFEASPLT